MRPERERGAFRGTQRYVSVRVHERCVHVQRGLQLCKSRKDQCRADDVVGLFYTFLELLTGGLPWKLEKDQEGIVAKKRVMKVDKVRNEPSDPTL